MWLVDLAFILTNLFQSHILQVSFSLPRGGVVGVIGANGVGKSTLFKMVRPPLLFTDENPMTHELIQPTT